MSVGAGSKDPTETSADSDVAQPAAPPTAPRDDVLVSICFADLPATIAGFEAVAALSRRLDSTFRFREIIVVAEESKKVAFLPLVQRIENLRLLTVRDGTAFYNRRVIAAEEAIGDVVLIAHLAELAYIDPLAMIDRVVEGQRVLQAAHSATVAQRILGLPLTLLGRAAGFKVDLRSLQTLAAPRTLLVQLLAHPAPDLALRFPPRDTRVPLDYINAASAMHARREVGQQWQRIVLLHKLLVFLAPSLLTTVMLTSGILAIFGCFFGLYVIGAWIFLDDLAPGWLTLSAMLSMLAFFLGVSVMGLSLGLQLLLKQSYRDGFQGVVAETNRIDLFGQVVSELNINNDREHSEAPDAPQ